jgi:BRCA2, oligonucleotide/oligosaccharide-binding, domain 1/BRCA2, helical
LLFESEEGDTHRDGLSDCDPDCIGGLFGPTADLQDRQKAEPEHGCQIYASFEDRVGSPKGLFTPRTISGVISRIGLKDVRETSSIVLRETTESQNESVSNKKTSVTCINNLAPVTREIDHVSLVTPRQLITAGNSDLSVMPTPKPFVTHTPARTITDTPQNVRTESTFYGFLDAFKGGHFTQTVEECLSAGISRWVLQTSSENAWNIRFSSKTGFPLGFSDSTGSMQNGITQCIGAVDDYMQALCALHPGADRGINDNWIKNHLRWIVWKLASMERRFALYLAGQILTYDNVVQQLSIRYDREIRQGLRSSLRKVVNRDASSTSMMILCVARIQCHQTEDSARKFHYVLELTDGWYSVRAEIDEALSAFIDQKLVIVGTKLLICNAKLVGLQEGTDHLDDSFDVFTADRSPHLKLRANGCRIARWNAKLGFVSPARHIGSDSGLLMIKRLRDVCVHGGSIPQIDLVVVASDPVKYLERSKDGRTTKVWSEAEESDRIEKKEKSRQKLVEQFRDEITKECEDVSSRYDM